MHVFHDVKSGSGPRDYYVPFIVTLIRDRLTGRPGGNAVKLITQKRGHFPGSLCACMNKYTLYITKGLVL